MLVDCGLNLMAAPFAERRLQILSDAARQQVTRFVLIGACEASSREAVAFASEESGCIATVGVHPHNAAAVHSEYLATLRALAQDSSVRAIGECGLDYHRNFSPPDVQRKVFAAQLELAAELQLPVYLHEREALADQLAILDEYRHGIPALFTHCFTGNRQALEHYLQRDCYIGVTGWVCDERRGADLQAAVAEIPEARLLLETDAPYLLPRTIRPRPKSHTNFPSYLPYVLAKVAALRHADPQQLIQQTTDNALRLFGDWKPIALDSVPGEIEQ